MSHEPISRRSVLKAMAAAPLLGLGVAASKPELAVGRLPDGRRLYQLNRVGQNEPIHFVGRGRDGRVVSAQDHGNRFLLRLAEAIDEVNGEPVPEWPRTHSVWSPGYSWEDVIRLAGDAFTIGGAEDVVQPDQILVQPEAKEPVYYSDVPTFTRYTTCPHCYMEVSVSEIRNFYADSFRYDIAKGSYLTCPFCSRTDYWSVFFCRVAEKAKTKLHMWDPKEIETLIDPFDESTRYVWVIPEKIRQQVRAGDLATLETIRPGVISAIRHKTNYVFLPDAVHHIA